MSIKSDKEWYAKYEKECSINLNYVDWLWKKQDDVKNIYFILEKGEKRLFLLTYESKKNHGSTCNSNNADRNC